VRGSPSNVALHDISSVQRVVNTVDSVVADGYGRFILINDERVTHADE
jgi:hypothetical protein